MTHKERGQLSKSRNYFDSTVGGLEDGYFAYRWGATPMRREHYLQMREALRRVLGRQRFKLLLEVGPGSCVWTPLFAEVASHVVAVDLSWAMLQDGRRQAGGWSLSCGDAAALPIRSGSADALCSSRAFEYFPDPSAAVAEFRRVLKPGGFVLIATKNREFAGYRQRDARPSTISNKAEVHSGNLSAGELTRLFSSHGFENVRLRPALMGRSNAVGVWAAVRFLRRVADPSWARLPGVISDSCESIMLTASSGPEGA